MNATFSHKDSELAAGYSQAAERDVALRCWLAPVLIVGEG
jgi:hypothetical protein